MQQDGTLAASRKVRPAPWDEATLTTYQESAPGMTHDAIPGMTHD